MIESGQFSFAQKFKGLCEYRDAIGTNGSSKHKRRISRKTKKMCLSYI